MSHDGGPQFPPLHSPHAHPAGMTLLDWYAGQVLPQVCDHWLGKVLPPGTNWNDLVAGDCFDLAERMVRESSRRKVAAGLPPDPDGTPALLFVHDPMHLREAGRPVGQPSPGARVYMSGRAVERQGFDVAAVREAVWRMP